MSADDHRAELETYQAQLAQELTTLKTGLVELIELTQAAIAAEPAAKSSSSKRREEEASSSQHTFRPATSWYPGRIVSVGGAVEKRVYSVVQGTKRKLSKEEEEERERKKKRNEKKLEVRATKAKEQNEKQSSWQKFTKKAEKKGIVIAGSQGTSIFKTPENAHGKVGVTNSGKGMTAYSDRVKHKYNAEDAS
ncbi:hypothetical protein BKA62DRAFT_692716 [Auriculariales sp. MPI-PUGE-AT-0066]|nr:hypothetical protein BKA62DRAFT_692716 [Auriculariales sp. MPI-PUGE-AT-0066]